MIGSFEIRSINLELSNNSLVNNRMRFEKHMESLGRNMESKNNLQTCKDSSRAIVLIDENIRSFKKEEPDYNWKEIRSLLLEINSKYCN